MPPDAPTTTELTSADSRLETTVPGSPPDLVDDQVPSPSNSVSVERPLEDRFWANSRFWVLQLVILAIVLIRLAAMVAFHLDQQSAPAEFSTFALLLIPMAVGAVYFGFEGTVVTSLWVTLLCIPRLLYFSSVHSAVGFWSEVVQVALLDCLALLLGRRVSAEREARRLAETAREDHLNAEARYRQLFEGNQAPILIVDMDGNVVEANQSAARTFRASAKSKMLHPSAHTPIRLIDLIGPEASAQVLTTLLTTHRELTVAEDSGVSGPEPVEPVAFEVDGERVLYRTTATAFGGLDREKGTQVVFVDVTAETRRNDRMEAYAARVVLGQEEERRHLAQELHDGPLQSLIHLCRQIDQIGQVAPPNETSDQLNDWAGLRRVAEGTVAELRSIARGLRPSVLDDLGLVASVTQMLTEAAERQGFETSFGITGSERRMSSSLELALFRITQEALSNIERHADASRVAVGINFESGGMRLLIKDDGVGFDTEADRAVGTSQSLGLPGMRERAHLIGCRLVIHSESGNGTTVDVWVPSTVLEPE